MNACKILSVTKKNFFSKFYKGGLTLFYLPLPHSNSLHAIWVWLPQPPTFVNWKFCFDLWNLQSGWHLLKYQYVIDIILSIIREWNCASSSNLRTGLLSLLTRLSLYAIKANISCLFMWMWFQHFETIIS